MAKSSGNVFLIEELIERGFDPLSFRYLCMNVLYRHRMNFTFTSLRAAEKALTNLRRRVWLWSREAAQSANGSSHAGSAGADEFRRRFWDAVDADLDLPRALAITWEMARSELSSRDKLALILEFDEMFGLDLHSAPDENEVGEEVVATLRERESLRVRRTWETADAMRARLSADGYVVEDALDGSRVRPKTAMERRLERWDSVSSSREVSSLLHEPSQYEFTFILNAYGYPEDVRRCVNGMLRHSEGRSAEVIVIDSGSTDGTGEMLEEMRREHENLRVIHCDHVIGDAASKNIGIKQSLGKHLIIVDGSAEIVGDILGQVEQQLSDPSVGIFGPYGLTTDDMQHFHEEVAAGEADAMQAYCMSFRREAVNTVGLMREVFRFYRNLDIDYCFQFKDKGYRVVADSSLPLVRHEHRQWTELDDNQRDELSRKNFGRFLKRWGNRPDLLITAGARGFGSQFRH